MLGQKAIATIEMLLARGYDVQVRGDRGKVKIFSIQPKLAYPAGHAKGVTTDAGNRK